MKLLAIHGSPRRNGSSSTLHSKFIQAFSAAGVDVEEIYVYDKNISPCTACGACKERLACPANDDMTEIYSMIQKADIISISTPLYFSSVPSQLKALVDRCQVFWEEKQRGTPGRIAQKQGVLICTAGAEYTGMFSGVIQMTRHYFNTINASITENDMLLVPGLDSSDNKKISLEIINAAVKLSERITAGINRQISEP